MPLSSIRGEEYLVLSEGNVGGGGGFNWIFVSEREKAGRWWQIMEAIFEVQRIELVEPVWVKGKGRADSGLGTVADPKSLFSLGTFSISCSCCGVKMEVGVNKKETMNARRSSNAQCR